jgi:hypothetical protein
MHLIIANRIAEEIYIQDKNSFLLGGIAPDAVSPKDASHFFKGDVRNYTRSIDYQGYLEKYRRYQNSPYMLGYYTHLIADDIWLKGFYLPWIKNRMEVDPEIHTRYHQDFRLLNGKLLKFYDSKRLLIPFIQAEHAEVIELDEVQPAALESFIPHVLEDMNYPEEHLSEPLQVFTEEQIIGYIETSVEKGIMHLQEIFNKVISK